MILLKLLLAAVSRSEVQVAYLEELREAGLDVSLRRSISSNLRSRDEKSHLLATLSIASPSPSVVSHPQSSPGLKKIFQELYSFFVSFMNRLRLLPDYLQEQQNRS